MRSADLRKYAENMRKYAEKYAEICGRFLRDKRETDLEKFRGRRQDFFFAQLPSTSLTFFIYHVTSHKG